MSDIIRDPWNPWTTSFAMTRVAPDSFAGHSQQGTVPTPLALGLVCLAWQRDEQGAIAHLPIDAGPIPILRE